MFHTRSLLIMIICANFMSIMPGAKKLISLLFFFRQGGVSSLNNESPMEIFLIQKQYDKAHSRKYINYFLKVLHFYSLSMADKNYG